MVAVVSRYGAAASLQEPNDMLEEVRNGLLTAAAFNARISKNYDSVAEEYINELIRTLPHASAAAIYNYFHFTVGTMLVACAESGRIERLSKGKVPFASGDETRRRTPEPPRSSVGPEAIACPSSAM
jgi:hypothetical protein